MSKFSGLALAVDTAARLIIQHPITGKPLRDAEGNEAWVELLSLDSTAAQKFEKRITDKRLARKVRSNIMADELQAEAAQRLASLTVGWKLLGLDGSAVDVPFTTKDAEELYADNSMAWLREQVEAFLANRANFMQGSSKS